MNEPGAVRDQEHGAPLPQTLDGLGPVGAGAHAADEHILVSRTLKRTALLALLLLLPPFSAHAGSRASHALVGRAV